MPILLMIVVLTNSLSMFPTSGAQEGLPEVVSALGARFHAEADENDSIPQAQRKLEADPRNLELTLELGHAQARVRRYRDAISTYTRGIEIDPKNAMLYRYRGHRFISTRQLDKAVNDLEAAAKLNASDFDIWYHLGLAYYLQGKFERAAAAYEKCRAVAKDDDSIIAVSDWLYMSYRRANKPAEAAQVLEPITERMKVVENKAYFDRLLFYKGIKKETDLITDGMTDLDIATIGYGVGNWHLYNGDRRRAIEYFEKIVGGTYWPAFGFIAAEAELVRMR